MQLGRGRAPLGARLWAQIGRLIIGGRTTFGLGSNGNLISAVAQINISAGDSRLIDD